MISRLIGAGVRAFLVAMLFATPSLVLPGTVFGDNDAVAVVALAAAAMTFFEYAAIYPGLVEFRDAPPFNRIRFLTLLFTLLLLSLAVRNHLHSSLGSMAALAVGHLIGNIIDFPYSPVRLVVLMLPDGMAPNAIQLVRSCAGLAYLISLVMLSIFSIVIRIGVWPNRDRTFNVWINLPTFNPSADDDVVAHLNHDARVNIVLGFALPFLTPMMAGAASGLFDPMILASPRAMVWVITLWAFLPASLFMRGIAMGRIADMIEAQRSEETELRPRHLLSA